MNSDNDIDARRATDVFLVESANTDVALNAAVTVLQQNIGASGVAVALAQGRRLVCRARAGEIAPAIGVALRVMPAFALMRASMPAVCRTFGIRSILVTPILVG